MNAGDTAWTLISTALILLMTPGIALFYGGMSRTRNVLNTLMMSLAAIPVVTIVWVAAGWTLTFGDGVAALGGLEGAGLSQASVPELASATFQMMFAIVAVALIAGAVAGRMRFSAWLVFATVWALVVYPIVGRSLFTPDGLLRGLGAVDHAGGLVVHVAAGASALALALVLGPRRGARRDRPHSLPLTVVGGGLLWFGWFGFNAGSAVAAGDLAVTSLLATHVAASVGMAVWMALEWRSSGSPTLLGTLSGAIAGLVAITPAAGLVSPLGAAAIGAVGAGSCWLAVSSRHRVPVDDALDVVGLHLVGGAVGSLLVAVFADPRFGSGATGLASGSPSLVVPQIVATVTVAVVAFSLSWLIATAIDRALGLRVTERQEMEGLDITLHEERAYSSE